MFLNVLFFIVISFGIGAYVWQNAPKASYVSKSLNSSYHFIIVGGGTAGCVLASRLTEDPDVSVLLIEAGYEDNELHIAEIPLAATELQRRQVDWSYMMEPQRNACLGFEENQIRMASGLALGGSSLINNLVYSRGNPQDFETWLADGCEGWGYEDVLPYFIKAERAENKQFVSSEYHGKSGNMAVNFMSGTTLSSNFLRAGLELGHKQVDYNSQQQLGVSNTQATIQRGSRVSTSGAYLKYVIDRSNLHVATRALVKKVVFKDNRAVAVEVLRNETILTIKARTEVILCAGAIGTPKLLQLSGIGPKAHLESLEIPVIADLPVGDNLRDHVFPLGVQFTINQPISAAEQASKTFMSLLSYLVWGDGMFSSSGVDALGFFRSRVQADDNAAPHLELQLHNSLHTTIKDPDKRESLRKTFNMKPEVFEALFGNLVDTHGFMLAPILLHPLSSGTVRLRSAHFRDPPIIDPRYLSHPRDEEILLEGIRLAESFASTRAFKSIGATALHRTHPGCRHLEYGSDEYWRCFIRHNVYTAHHVTSTCKMGAVQDPSAVVTPQLRVKGISNLRVVDASIIPAALSGDPSATVVMIAEKAADLILNRITVTRRGEGLLFHENEFAEFDDDDLHDEL